MEIIKPKTDEKEINVKRDKLFLHLEKSPGGHPTTGKTYLCYDKAGKIHAICPMTVAAIPTPRGIAETKTSCNSDCINFQIISNEIEVRSDGAFVDVVLSCTGRAVSPKVTDEKLIELLNVTED